MPYYSDEIRKSLDLILNKGFCCHTYMRAAKEYNAITDKLLEEDRVALWVSLLNVSPYYPDGDDCAYNQLANCIKTIKNRQTISDKIPAVYCSEETLSCIKRDNYRLPLHKANRQKDFSWYDKYPKSYTYIQV